MRVLLVILHAQAARGGAERYTRDLAAAVLGRGVRVATAALDFDPDWPGERRLLAAKALTRAGEYGLFLDALDTLLLSDSFDIVHAMLPVRRCDLYHPHAGVAAARKRAGVIEALNRRRRAMGATEFDLLTGPNPPTTIALSQYVLRAVREIYPRAPAEVLLNGVDLARFDPAAMAHQRDPARAAWGVKENELAALIVAQDFERKGVPAAVEALTQLRDLPIKLVVVGRDDPEPVERLAKSLGVSDRLVLPGPMADTRPAYAGADLFCLPSHHDPCSLVVIEALAMGLPTISTVFNGSSEWMTDGVEGRVLGAVDPGLIAAALREFSGQTARTAAHEACLRLRPRLSFEAHYEKLTKLYQKVRH